MDKPMTFEEWWTECSSESLRLMPSHFSSIEKWKSLSAWNARDAELLVLRKENEQMRDGIKQAIVYMETENPGNSFRLMCLNVLRLTSTPAKEEKA